MTEMNFLAGAAKRRITPPLDQYPVFLAGFQQNRRATEIDLDLYVRALAIRHDDQMMVLVACDLIGLSLFDVADIRSQLANHDIDPQGLIIACTHTHSAPDTLGLWGPQPSESGVYPGYLALVKQAIIAVAIEALTFCCPVRMRSASTHLPGFIQNLRTPEVIDSEVTAIQFIKQDGEIVATLLNLACHPEVLEGSSTALSADYAGAACAAVEATVGGMALHVSGALGGMLSPAVRERTPAGVPKMGQAYAEVALSALQESALVEPTVLTIQRTAITFPQHNPLFQQAQQLGILRPRPGEEQLLISECLYVDLGPAQILTIPGELLPKLGFVLKMAMPGPCCILAGIANDELGYILPDDEFVTPADYSNPGAQYEESMSLGPETGSIFIQAALNLIRR